MFKIAISLCFVAAAPAAAVPAALPIARYGYSQSEPEPEPHYPAQYEYSYSVQDELNGDIKQQKENRDGNAVHGFYSFIQPDGTRRIVEYTADKEHGFNAVIRYEGQSDHASKQALEAPANVVYASASEPQISHRPAPPKRARYSPPVSKFSFAQSPSAYAPSPFAYAAAAIPNIVYAPAPFALHRGASVAKVAYSSPAFSYYH